MANTDDDAEQNQRYRLGLPEWLHQQVDSGLHKNVFWIDEKEHIFQIPWKHASMNCWENTDASLFKAWAVYTNRYQEGVDKPKHKQWKSNFRCAINSHNRVFFIKEQDRGKDANRRVIRLVGPAGAEKKFENRVPKRKSYKSSRSSKARDESSEDRDLNSVEALENCARLLLSLKRSNSICSSGSASSSMSFEADTSYHTTNCSEKSVAIWDNKDGDKDREDYAITRIKQVSINNSDWNTTSAKENPFCVRPGNSQKTNEENRKKDIVNPIETKKVDFPFSDEGCPNRLSGKPAELASSLQEPRGNTVTAEYSTKQRSLASGENSTGHPFPKPEPNTQMKCFIPTTVIVTINNNFNWQNERDVSSYRGNSYDNKNAIEKVKEEDEDCNDNTDDKDNDDDLIMPRNWR